MEGTNEAASGQVERLSNLVRVLQISPHTADLPQNPTHQGSFWRETAQRPVKPGGEGSERIAWVDSGTEHFSVLRGVALLPLQVA